MMSRIAASVMKPSRTSMRPIGMLFCRCSASAMPSWSAESNPPSRIAVDCGRNSPASIHPTVPEWERFMDRTALLHDCFELADARLDGGTAEVGAAPGCHQPQRAPVILERQFWRRDVFEADREI